MQDGHASADAGITPGLAFRAAGLDDYATIRHIQSSAIRALSERMLDAADVSAALATIHSSDYINQLMTKSTFLAVMHGDPIGTCSWSPGDDRGHAARVSGLFVMPLFQGGGIGRSLLVHVETDASRHGYTRLNAIAPVAVAGLFKDLDYAVTSFGTSREVIPGVSVQVAFMRKPE
jgi:GNAT superfamily N-acetyltransferase